MPNPLPQIVASGHSIHSAPQIEGYTPVPVIDLDCGQKVYGGCPGAECDRPCTARAYQISAATRREMADHSFPRLFSEIVAIAFAVFAVIVIVVPGADNIHNNIIQSQEP